MIDVIDFECNGSLYVYDIPSGNIVKCNRIQLEIMKVYNLDNKKIIKELRGEFQFREIIDNLGYVKELLKYKLISEKPTIDNSILFDYSNMVSLKTIYYHCKTQNVIKSFELLKKNFFMDTLYLISNENLNEVNTEKNQEVSSDAFANINYFLGKWEYKCQFNAAHEWITAYRNSIEKIDISSEVVTSIIENKERVLHLPKLVKYVKNIIMKQKKQFPCSAGFDSLYINKNGEIYICKDGIKVYDFYVSNHISLLTSIYEEKPCCDCFVRFLCGGYCKSQKSKNIELCLAFAETSLVLFKICAILMEIEKNMKNSYLGWSEIK